MTLLALSARHQRQHLTLAWRQRLVLRANALRSPSSARFARSLSNAR